MPDLKSDIVGRVGRLPLRHSEYTALLPLMEAISNSVYSITERFASEAVAKGSIIIRILRDENQDHQPIMGFEIEDNGIGFTDQNYKSFLTPDSRLKEKKGGKGVGRLAWLKVFARIEIDSQFMVEADMKSRRFIFQLTEQNQVEELAPAIKGLDKVRTIIKLLGFNELFSVHCPAKSSTTAARIVAHFVPLFVAGNAPKIILSDGENTDIEALFTDSIIDQETKEIVIEGSTPPIKLSLWSLKCKKSVKFNMAGSNFAFITGDNRSVVEYCLAGC